MSNLNSWLPQMLIGLSLLSIGAAGLYFSCLRKQLENRGWFISLAVFFGLAGVLQFIQAVPHIPSFDEVEAEQFLSTLACLFGVWAWVIVHKALQMPTKAEFEAVTKSLEQARNAALESSALKSGFIANMRHEIRTPLTGLLGMNELLLLTELTTEQRELASTVQKSGESLLHIMNAFLDLSAIEVGRLRLHLRAFSLPQLLESCISLMAAAAKDKDLVLQLETERLPDVVIGDAERLRQVLLNLVSNAIKFTPQGTVVLKARLLQETDSDVTVEFAVKDTGIGISDADSELLFEPFWKRDMSNTRRHGGLGLGLSLSQHLVEKMGGKGISVSSKLKVGSEFVFAIPLAKEGGEIRGRAKGGRPTRRSVLVVANNNIVRNSIVKQLESLGVDSVSATSENEAIAMVDKLDFDVILLDCALPANVYELSRNIHRHQADLERPDSAIVGLTSLPPLELGQSDPENEGLVELINKPVRTRDLYRLVDKWSRKGA